jgi:chitinase domain-containing protein 1
MYRKYGFDGVVIECGYPAYFQRFLAELADELHKEDRELIVVLPSIMNAKHRKYMGPDLFGSMANYVDYFSLMSYDYSSHDP